MTRTLAARGKLAAALLVGLLLSASVALWWQWHDLRAWYTLRGLMQATDEDRAAWIERVTSLDEAALPGLLACLRREEERACELAATVLERLAQKWHVEPARQSQVVDQLSQQFPELSSSGQRAALHLAVNMGGAAAVPAARLTRLLTRALEQPDDAVRLLALERTLQLRASATTEELTSLVKAVTTLGLRDPRPELRSNAIRLAQTAGADLLSQVASLLDDPAPEVRRAALLAVGAQRDAIAEDDLLRWLHDPDDQVRQLCEQALRGRGLSDQHLKLGRLLTAPQPATRMLVLEQLRRADDLDPRVWLRRLSHDPDPAVRAAAIRATTELPAVDLHDRVEQIARDDPSPTVRELARFYLRTGTAARQP